MKQTAIFWPMIAHAALVFGVYILIFLRRIAALKAGNARASQFRENRDEPAESLFVRNNLANQFELPVLFYAVGVALYVTGGSTTAALVLAWIFTLSRYLHAFIHITSNRIRYRQPAFALGYLALGMMWLLFAWHLLTLP